jgi:hypothetical protein
MEKIMPHLIKKAVTKQEQKRGGLTDTQIIMRTLQRDYLSVIRRTENIAYRDVVKLAWDENTIDAVEKTAMLVDNLSSDNIGIDGNVSFCHPALPPFTAEINFVLEPPSNRVVLWPKNWGNHPNIWDENIANKMNIVAGAALEAGLLKKLFQWLGNNCRTHEQAAWLFPFWATVCQQATELEETGHRVADAERPKILPAVPPDIRALLKYFHLFMAQHTLMGTFEIQDKKQDPTMCRLRMMGEHTIKVMMGELPVMVTI